MPSEELLVIRQNHKTGQRSLDLLQWGLIPHWCKDPTGGRKPINAMSETVARLPTFREAYQKRRCILPVDGFYEWRATKRASVADQRLRRVAKPEVAGHQPGRKINLSLVVEGVEQSGPERPLIGGQVVEPVVLLARDAGRRHIAREIEGDRTVQHSPRRREVIDSRDPDPPEHLAERVGVGEDVVRRLPVGVLVGVAEASHPKRRPVCERAAKINGSAACADSRLDRFSDLDRIVAKQLPSERRMLRPAVRAVACREQLRHLAGRFVAKRDKIDRLAPFGRFLGAPGRRHLADDGWQHRGSVAPSRSCPGTRTPC